MQETTTVSPADSVQRDIPSAQSLVALLALVGTRQMDVEALRERTKLTQFDFGNLLGWLQREYFVDIISNLEGDQVKETAQLTERGEAALVSMLEKTCELPELR
jgi:hypothetical protein